MITQAHQAHPELSVQRLCELFELSRSWYYEHLKQPEDDAEEIALRDRIEEIILEFAGYGYRRVTHALAREGWRVNHKRVLRIMQEESLLCHLKKRFVIATTNSRHHFPVYPNELAGIALERLDQAWVADLTYIRLRSAFVYLACILDAFSRRCLGWALRRSLEAALALEALHMALRLRRPKPGLVHHSDRGVQYASQDYAAELQQHGIRISMSRIASPCDNAQAESFIKTLKYEEVYRTEYRSLEDARASIGEFLEKIYNRERLHSALGYRPPLEFERHLRCAQAMGRGQA